MSHRRQALVGLGLAIAILAAWLAAQSCGALLVRLEGAAWLAALPLALLICWLDVGLFILAHDAMHGSLAPRFPSVNRRLGQVALLLYGGFSFDRLRAKHFDHHRAPGSAEDPDFHDRDPHAFLDWYAAFLRQYFGLRELAGMAFSAAFYLLVLRGPAINLLVFWAAPAWLSSLQLFLFGTWLPHRHSAGAFVDRHRARSSDLGWLASLISCFHFGYHLEHHRAPHLPWWRLPAERARQRG